MKLLSLSFRMSCVPLAAVLLLGSARANAQYATTAISVRVPAAAPDEESHGSPVVRGALWGGVIGLGVGVVGALTGDSCVNTGSGTGTHCDPLSGGQKAAVIGVSTAVGAALGAVIGAVVGHRDTDHSASAPRAALEVRPSTVGLRFSI